MHVGVGCPVAAGLQHRIVVRALPDLTVPYPFGPAQASAALTLWAADLPGISSGFFTAWFSSTNSIDPIHQTLHANSASIPAANRLYQGQTDVIDLIHRGPVSLPTSGSRSIGESPEIPCGGCSLLGSSQVTAL